jgi:hypothetical protein
LPKWGVFPIFFPSGIFYNLFLSRMARFLSGRLKPRKEGLWVRRRFWP